MYDSRSIGDIKTKLPTYFTKRLSFLQFKKLRLVNEVVPRICLRMWIYIIYNIYTSHSVLYLYELKRGVVIKIRNRFRENKDVAFRVVIIITHRAASTALLVLQIVEVETDG